MGDKSKIEWTDATWNPSTGCDRTSPGCDNCYALTLAKRLKAMGAPNYQNDGDPRTSGPGFGVMVHKQMLDQPLKWKRPRRIFVNSMSDLFHPDVPFDFIADVFAVMAVARQHTFQVLTKRAQRMAALLGADMFRGFVDDAMTGAAGGYAHIETGDVGWPLPNVWLGVSIESDAYAFRADYLRRTPAAVRWISAEPLLGPLPSLDLSDIDWVVAGGESGPGARPMHPDWARDLRDRCTAPPDWRADEGLRPRFLFKQWGEWAPIAGHNESYGRWVDPVTGATRAVATPAAALMSHFGKRAAGRDLDGRTWDEYPEVVACG
ncbi:MAG: phage Gp37/Gp68 family protein [Actinomycetota bacterium]|nr:phage Gp37/Gp68 family protein [Actinomycetota bacterium]